MAEEGLDKFTHLTAGDYIDGVDDLVRELNNDEDFPSIVADYENIYTDSVGYLAKVTLNGRVVATVDALNGDPMIRKVKEHAVAKAIKEAEEDSEIQKMLHKEGFSRLDIDKDYNTLTIYDDSGGDVVTTISLDLIHEMEKVAEKSEDDVVVRRAE